MHHGETIMQVALLLAADYANVAQGGKLNVMGIFDNIAAANFPARHGSMHLVVKLAAEPGESNQTRTVTILLLDEDGGELMRVGQEIQVPQGASGRRPEMNFIMELRDLTFQTPGIYEFVVQVDLDTKATLPIYLIQQQPGEPA